MILDKIKKFIKIKKPVTEEPVYYERPTWEDIENQRLKELEESLKEGEMVCPECNGMGYIDKIPSDNFHVFKERCPKCLGAGKLDWIENVVGKKEMYYDGTCFTNVGIT